MGLAARGAKVYMVCRNSKAGEEAKKIVIEKTNNSNVYLLCADISRPKQIQNMVQGLVKDNVHVDVLVCTMTKSLKKR
jgi:NAD(P)-dependent dehydrogenase (short-subunit alcohol dehydrogenase family)